MFKNHNKRSIIFLICAFAAMALIFYFSSHPAEQSKEMSKWVTSTIFTKIWPEVSKAELRALNHNMRKFAHFFMFGVLGFLLCLSFSIVDNPKRPLLTSWGFGLFYAMTDELHQYFVYSRGAQWRDVGLDFCGVAAGSIIAVLILKCHAYFKTVRLR